MEIDTLASQVLPCFLDGEKYLQQGYHAPSSQRAGFHAPQPGIFPGGDAVEDECILLDIFWMLTAHNSIETFSL